MTIVKYANRKLYNLDAHRYVTLAGVRDLVRANREVTVTDHVTGKDVTSVVLAEVIYVNRQDREAEKLRRRLLEKERQNDELRCEVARLRGLVPSEPYVLRSGAPAQAEKTAEVG